MWRRSASVPLFWNWKFGTLVIFLLAPAALHEILATSRDIRGILLSILFVTLPREIKPDSTVIIMQIVCLKVQN
jgi:hypothetical protein